MITDEQIGQLEVAALQCGNGWYDTQLDMADIFPDQDEDLAFCHMASPELIRNLIKRLRAAEATT